MFRRCVFAVCILAMASVAAAQQPPTLPLPPDAPVAQPTPKPGRPVQPVPAPTPPAPGVRVEGLPLEAARKIRGKDLNVQIEITISDQAGSSAPEKKVVTLLAADQTMGR